MPTDLQKQCVEIKELLIEAYNGYFEGLLHVNEAWNRVATAIELLNVAQLEDMQ